MGIGIVNNAVQFRGTAYNENGVPYYKSGKGTTAGVAMAIPAIALNLGPLTNDKERLESETIKFYETLGFKIDDKGRKYIKEMVDRQKRLVIPYAITAGVCTLGAGILYDKVRNDKAKRVANDVYAGNVEKVRAEDGDIGISQAGIPYYKSKNGIKYGALTGAICGLVRGAMDCFSAKRFDIRAIIGGPVLFALGGILMGVITQKAANKDAEKSTYLD